MEQFFVVGPMAPFHDAVLPRTTRFAFAMNQPHFFSLKRTLPLFRTHIRNSLFFIVIFSPRLATMVTDTYPRRMITNFLSKGQGSRADINDL
jgi:hypothetical protein